MTLTKEDGSTETATTDAKGYYEFTNLPNGEYKVNFETPEGYVPTVANSGDADKDSNGVETTVVVKDADDVTIDSGFYKEEKTYKVGDFVWEDTNKDGIQGADEKGIEGVTVTLTKADGSTETTVTKADGSYEFVGLPNGEYTVEFQTPEGYLPSPTGNGSADKDSNGAKTTVVVKDADDVTIDSGFYKEEKTYTIGDYVWEDVNEDGVQGADEKGIANVTVTLKDAEGKLVQTVQTDDQGKYAFTNLANGDYTVEFETPAGYVPTKLNGSEDTAKDSNGKVVNVTVKDADNLTIDSGFHKEAPKQYAIGDYVWEDTNKDGIQGADEKGLEGVKVTLKDASGKAVGTTVTNKDGRYLFTDLNEGTYTVEFETPAGYVATKQDAPGSDEKDSDGQSVTVELKGSDNMSIDSGFYKEEKTYKVGDYVWEDANKDGIQGADEKGIEGVKVTLKDPSGKVVQTVTTDAKGYYVFTGLTNGEYTIEFETPAGYEPTLVRSGSDNGKDSDGNVVSITVKDADNLTIDSGFTRVTEPPTTPEEPPVTPEEPPVTPEKPQTPPATPETPAKPGKETPAKPAQPAPAKPAEKKVEKALPDTGAEQTNAPLWATLLAGLGAVLAFGRRRQNKK